MSLDNVTWVDEKLRSGTCQTAANESVFHFQIRHSRKQVSLVELVEEEFICTAWREHRAIDNVALEHSTDAFELPELEHRLDDATVQVVAISDLLEDSDPLKRVCHGSRDSAGDRSGHQMAAVGILRLGNA